MLHAVLPLLASLGNVPVSQQQITGYYQLTNDGSTGPCRGTTPNDNDRSAFGTNVLTTNTTDCTSCAALCSANVNITGYPRQCVAFECTPSLSNNVIGYLGRRCELWAKTPYFAARSSCASLTDSSCNSPTDGYHCFVKNTPPPPPPLIVPGYVELTNDGFTGPCRGTTPTDNDRSAFGLNLLTTETTDCATCAALCNQNKNITGYPRQCVAFECTPSLSDNVIGYLGRRCELWAKTPYFAARSSCASMTDSSCNSPTDGYHCFVKTGNPFAAASASSTLAGNEASHSVVVALFVLILLMLIGMSALVFILFRRASVPAPMTRLHEVELNKK